jgi:hypothetical protein
VTHVAYLVAGYGVTTGAIGLYTTWVLRRRRALMRQEHGQGR